MFMVHIGYHKIQERDVTAKLMSLLWASPFFVTRENIWVHDLHVINKLVINHEICHNKCSHLLLVSSSFCFLHLAEVLQYCIIKEYILAFNYTHVSWPSTHFNALFLMNSGENKRTILTSSCPMLLWLPATWISVKHNLTYLSRW